MGSVQDTEWWYPAVINLYMSGHLIKMIPPHLTSFASISKMLIMLSCSLLQDAGQEDVFCMQ